MPKIDLTNKPLSAQVNLVAGYLKRRMPHVVSNEVITLEQLMERFKDSRWRSDRVKKERLSFLLSKALTLDPVYKKMFRVPDLKPQSFRPQGSQDRYRKDNRNSNFKTKR